MTVKLYAYRVVSLALYAAVTIAVMNISQSAMNAKDSQRDSLQASPLFCPRASLRLLRLASPLTPQSRADRRAKETLIGPRQVRPAAPRANLRPVCPRASLRLLRLASPLLIINMLLDFLFQLLVYQYRKTCIKSSTNTFGCQYRN
jgi:hypothetical protein